MYEIEISEEDKEKISQLRENNSNAIVRKRLLVLHYKCLKCEHKIIELMAECSSTFVTKTIKAYISGGLNEVLIVKRHRRVSELEEHKSLILEKLRESPPATVKEASDIILSAA
jgi:transposase